MRNHCHGMIEYDWHVWRQKENEYTRDMQLLKEALRWEDYQTKWYLLETPVQLFVQHDCYFRVRRKWKRDRDFSEPFVGIEFDIVLDSLMIFQKQETRGTTKWSSERWRLSTCSKEVTRTLSTRKESFLMPHCVVAVDILSINPRSKSQDSPNTWNQVQLHSGIYAPLTWSSALGLFSGQLHILRRSLTFSHVRVW